VVGHSNVNAELLSEPLCQRLEAAAQHGNLVTQSLQRMAELTGTIGNLQNGLELLEDISGDTVEKTNTLLERCREVQFAVHGAFGDVLCLC
jgi:hypothetical protein